jgi:hypothetical protein
MDSLRSIVETLPIDRVGKVRLHTVTSAIMARHDPVIGAAAAQTRHTTLRLHCSQTIGTVLIDRS